MAADRIVGYPDGESGRVALKSGDGARVLGYGHVVNCTRIPPNAPGSWISSKRCSYRFLVDGTWYAGRGYGKGMAFSGRRMKRPPRP